MSDKPRVRAALSRLASMDLSAEQAKVLDHQITDVVLLHLSRVSVYLPMRGQMELLARDAYFQGLIDGAQLPTRDRA